MTPYGFRSTLIIAAGATVGFLTFTVYGAIFGLLCVAWLMLPRSTPSDDILTAISDGRIRVYSPEQLRAKNSKE